MYNFNKEELKNVSETLDNLDKLMKFIKNIRNETGLSREDFAFWSDTPISTYKRYEERETIPDVDKMVRIIKLVSILMSIEKSVSKKEIKSRLVKELIE